MTSFFNIQSKIEFCISLFPQEFIKDILQRDVDDILLISIFTEGIYEASNMFIKLLDEYWKRDFNSIYMLQNAKQMIQLEIPMRINDYKDLLYACEKDFNSIDPSLIHSIRNELKIIKAKNEIEELINKLKHLLELEINGSDEPVKRMEDDAADLLLEYFVSCRYYKDILKNKSKSYEFNQVIKDNFKIINPSIFAREQNLIKTLESYMDLFIAAVNDNFIINQSYKSYENCIKLFRKDILKRDIKDFQCLKLLFTSFNSDSLKPFIWFDSKYDNDENIYENNIKSFEKCISNAIDKVSKIDDA